MQIAHCNHLFVAFGPFAKKPTIGKLECQLGAIPGAFMRIVEPRGVRLWRVTVAVGTESSGTLERACAWRNPLARKARKCFEPRITRIFTDELPSPPPLRPALRPSPRLLWLAGRLNAERRTLNWRTTDNGQLTTAEF